MIRVEGWRAALLLAVLVVAGLVFAVALTITLFWVGIVLALLVGVALLHLVYLPRAAAALRLPILHLTLWLLPALALAGWGVFGEPIGALWGGAVWAVGLVVPRVLAMRALRRAQRRAEQSAAGGTVVTLVGHDCPGCGQVAYGAAERCSRCGAWLGQGALPR